MLISVTAFDGMIRHEGDSDAVASLHTPFMPSCSAAAQLWLASLAGPAQFRTVLASSANPGTLANSSTVHHVSSNRYSDDHCWVCLSRSMQLTHEHPRFRVSCTTNVRTDVMTWYPSETLSQQSLVWLLPFVKRCLCARICITTPP